MPRVTWRDSYYVKAYELAGQGMSDTKIANTLDVPTRTFQHWKQTKVALRNALRRARRSSSKSKTFQDYVFGRLPPRLQELWGHVKELNRRKDVAALEQMLQDAGEKARQELFVYALTRFHFNPTKAGKLVCVGAKKFKEWCLDPEFAELVQEVEWHKLNFFEDAVIDAVQRGDRGMVRFVAETRLQERGYGKTLNVKHDHGGTVEHVHTSVPLDELDLPLAQRRAILEALRAKTAALPENVQDAEYEVKQ